MQIVVVHRSARVTAAEAAVMTAACALQLARDVAPAWGRAAPSVMLARDGEQAPAGALAVYLLDSPDVSGALGYHQEEADVPDAKVFASPVLDNGGVVLRDAAHPQNVSVASVLGHELIEMFVDADANLFADGPSIAQGRSYALEACDPVQGLSYDVTLGDGTVVAVSDFVTPAWFDPDAAAGTKTDFLGKCAGPFRLTPGGYMIVRTGPGSEQQVLGEQHPEWRRAGREGNPLSRLNRRRNY